MVNRRSFMGMVVGLLVVPFVTLKTKLKWYESGYNGPLKAAQFMTIAYNEHAKGSNVREHPHDIWLSTSLFEAFDSDLIVNQRFHTSINSEGSRALAFKCCRVHKMDYPGWAIVLQSKNKRSVRIL